MDIEIYLSPLDDQFTNSENWKNNTIGNKIAHANEKIADFDIALIGVLESRGAESSFYNDKGANEIRKQLYSLMNHFPSAKIIDLGNIEAGNTVEDTYFAVRSVVEQLVKKSVLPFILGGSQDITLANYKAYEALEQSVNVVTVDAKLDIGSIDGSVNDQNFVNSMIMHEPNYLFNYSNVGHQTYFVDEELLSVMGKMQFDTFRLGEISSNISEVEPIVRNADIVSFDYSSLRRSDSPGNTSLSPNGFSSTDFCAMLRYAGLSDKLSSIGIYGYDTGLDKEGVGAMCIAQALWYFIEGYSSRKGDYPVASKSEYVKYHVSIEEENQELVFYKSNRSGRWWIELPNPADVKRMHIRHHMIPCSYEDYTRACEGSTPERWWHAYHKLMQ